MSNKTVINIPKPLYSNKFKGMRDGPKRLYGFLLDYASVTRIVQDNRIYVLVTLKEISEKLGCSIYTAYDWLNILEKYNLIEKGERFGKTPKIYLKDADTGEEITEEYYNRKT